MPYAQLQAQSLKAIGRIDQSLQGFCYEDKSTNHFIDPIHTLDLP